MSPLHAVRAYMTLLLFLCSYNLGKGPAVIESYLNQTIRINEWNMIRAYRNGIMGYLEVNGIRVAGSSPKGLSKLNLDTDMYLGGGVESESSR